MWRHAHDEGHTGRGVGEAVVAEQWSRQFQPLASSRCSSRAAAVVKDRTAGYDGVYGSCWWSDGLW